MHSRSSELPPSSTRSDPLAAVIELLRPQTVLSKIVSGAGRWSVRYAAYEDPGFCLVLDGSCFLDVDGVGAIELEEGDFLLLPATPGFTMASDLALKPDARRPHACRGTAAWHEGGPTDDADAGRLLPLRPRERASSS